MAKMGPIILVDDDPEEEELFREVLRRLDVENKLIHFDTCIEAYKYLKSTTDDPLIIFSDINLPSKNGIEFKMEIDEDPHLRSKSIPFIFFSTSTDQKFIDIAYKQMTIQGYFNKTTGFQEMQDVIKLIIDYWKVCKHPNS